MVFIWLNWYFFYLRVNEYFSWYHIFSYWNTYCFFIDFYFNCISSRTWLSDFTFTFHFYALEKEMATHSSVLAWRIPGIGEPAGLPSMGSHRVGHDWSDFTYYNFNLCFASIFTNTKESYFVYFNMHYIFSNILRIPRQKIVSFAYSYVYHFL